MVCSQASGLPELDGFYALKSNWLAFANAEAAIGNAPDVPPKSFPVCYESPSHVDPRPFSGPLLARVFRFAQGDGMDASNSTNLRPVCEKNPSGAARWKTVLMPAQWTKSKFMGFLLAGEQAIDPQP